MALLSSSSTSSRGLCHAACQQNVAGFHVCCTVCPPNKLLGVICCCAAACRLRCCVVRVLTPGTHGCVRPC